MDSSRRARPVAAVGVLLLAVLLASWASVQLRPAPDAVATWWPAAGFSIAALLFSPRRWWVAVVPAVVAVTLLALASGDRPPRVDVTMAVANGAEALVGALVLQGSRRTTPRLVDPAGYLRLLLAAALGALTVAVVAEVGLALLGLPVGRTAPTVLPSHLAATLVVLPLLLLPRSWGAWRHRRVEAVAQTGLVAAVVVTTVLVPEAVAAYFVVVPLLLWGALRLPPLLPATQVAVVAAVTTWSTTQGAGALAGLGLAYSVNGIEAGSNLRAYLVCLALVAVPAALASEQRRQLVARLDTEREISATTLDTTAAIIVVTDAAGTVERANAALHRLTGIDPEAIVGRPIWESGFVPPERLDIVRDLYVDPAGHSVPTLREADVMTAEGERLRVVWNNNVVTDADGTVLHVVSTGTDITSELTTNQLVEHLFGSPKAAPMLSLDQDLTVSLYNAASAQLFGVVAEEVVGSPFTALVCPEQRADMEQALARASEDSRRTRTAATLEHQWSWMRPDGDVVRLSATVSAVVDAVGRQVGTLVVASDVTRQLAQEESTQRALDSERRAVERLRRLDTAKNDFVSTVSHELRTPTTSIVGYTEMLRDEVVGEITDDQRALLDVIARNGSRLIAVANDLLTLADLESPESPSGALEDEVDLAVVVAQSREAVAPMVAGRALELDFVVPASPVEVTGDAGHLDRVLVNLLSNAVKFTPDGGRVSCGLRTTPTTAVLEVADSGIGIPEAEQADLFTKFFRSSTAQERAIPGTGLGLSIIQRIVTDHGGQIEVSSAEGAGTTFTVTLPLASTGPRLVSPRRG